MSASIPVAPARAPLAAPATPESMLQRHLHATWRYLRMHGAEAHEADDLAQEAFVIALQKGAAELAPAATSTFLRRTARFLFLRARRDAKDAVQLADAVDELWARDCEGDGGEALLHALRQCVEELSGRAREAIEHSYGLGKATATARDATATALGLQPNGLKTLLQRTRHVLRGCIERRLA